MNLPGETETGSAGTQPCRGITGGLIEPTLSSAGNQLLALSVHHRIDRPHALKIPAPKGGILTNGERRFSISG